MSADIEPTDVDRPHHQGDVTPLLRLKWDMVVAFPPCTDLARVNARYIYAKRADGRCDRAAEFFRACLEANAPKVCAENPAGELDRLVRKPDQYIQPWHFGHPYTKRTGLWLRGLPPLMPTDLVVPTASWTAVNNYAPRANGSRQAARARTFQGVADAMARQWG